MRNIIFVLFWKRDLFPPSSGHHRALHAGLMCVKNAAVVLTSHHQKRAQSRTEPLSASFKTQREHFSTADLQHLAASEADWDISADCKWSYLSETGSGHKRNRTESSSIARHQISELGISARCEGVCLSAFGSCTGRSLVRIQDLVLKEAVGQVRLYLFFGNRQFFAFCSTTNCGFNVTHREKLLVSEHRSREAPVLSSSFLHSPTTQPTPMWEVTICFGFILHCFMHVVTGLWS